MSRLCIAILSCLVLCARVTAAEPANLAELRLQVADTERAFARSMAERDHAAFSRFLADEAIFYCGSTPLRGKEQIAAAWKRFFERQSAPFSWEPSQVDVLDSGTLAHSSGPVRDPSGKVIATFNSIWRLEAPGVWKIVFDKGCDACDCAGR